MQPYESHVKVKAIKNTKFWRLEPILHVMASLYDAKWPLVRYICLLAQKYGNVCGAIEDISGADLKIESIRNKVQVYQSASRYSVFAVDYETLPWKSSHLRTFRTC